MTYKYHFHTNLKCSGCVSAIAPGLKSLQQVLAWDVDLSSAEKLLVVEADELNPDIILKALQNAGFEGKYIPDQTLT